MSPEAGSSGPAPLPGAPRVQGALGAGKGGGDDAAMRACFVEEEKPVPEGPVTCEYTGKADGGNDTASLDRAIAAAGGLSIGTTGEDPMDDVD